MQNFPSVTFILAGAGWNSSSELNLAVFRCFSSGFGAWWVHNYYFLGGHIKFYCYRNIFMLRLGFFCKAILVSWTFLHTLNIFCIGLAPPRHTASYFSHSTNDKMISLPKYFSFKIVAQLKFSIIHQKLFISKPCQQDQNIFYAKKFKKIVLPLK